MTASRSSGSARIAAVLRGDNSDLAALAWLAEYVRPGDEVHLTVPYRELLVSGLRWSPALRAADAHRDRARHRLSAAVARLRALTDRDAEVNGSIVAARRIDLTADLAAVADLVVYAVPDDVPARYAFAEAVRCAAGPADVPGGSGAVVLVPEQHVVEKTTVLVPDVEARLRDGVIAVAADATTRCDGTLRIVRPSAVGSDAATVRNATAALEHEMQSWVDRCRPSTQPACVAEVVAQPLVHEIRLIGATIGLVVVASPPAMAKRAELSDLVAITMTEFAAPVMIVNDAVPQDVPNAVAQSAQTCEARSAS